MAMAITVILLVVACSVLEVRPQSGGGILYPRESETREVKTLDGIWNFKLSSPSDAGRGFREKWYLSELEAKGDTIPMPVPSSYNDITTDRKIRDHVGLVWYDRTFFVPQSWMKNKRIWLRFSSVCYASQVWINGELAMSHEIGHLPFQREVTQYLKSGNNLITVAVDNTLLQTTVPQGTIEELHVNNQSQLYQTYTFDFFNYAGIDRSVHLYTTPLQYIDDITVTTDIQGADLGIVNYEVSVGGANTTTKSVQYRVSLLDRDGATVGSEKTSKGQIQVPVARLWWPYLMDPQPGYMYTLQVELSSNNWASSDIYRQPVGIRTISWTNTTLLINGRPIYIAGFGRHEDFFIKGKGLDLSVVVRDYNLIKWVGANTYRTSHYPYAEEIMDMADQQGIMIIDECPSVDTVQFSSTLLQKHKDSLTQLIRRDKNRPSVIMWSAANEPRTQVTESNQYFKSVITHIKSLDPTRPTTIALSRGTSEDKVGQHLDIIGFNRYNSWYSNTGRTELIYQDVVNEATNWFTKYNKPVIMTEYGADTYPGLHTLPEYVWTEEYQVTVMSEHFKAFDYLRKQNFFIGEMIWNFADFMTAQTTTRVVGNKKGIFTRDRQPKASAHFLRKRYFALANELNNVPIPKDMLRYVSSSKKTSRRVEL